MFFGVSSDPITLETSFVVMNRKPSEAEDEDKSKEANNVNANNSNISNPVQYLPMNMFVPPPGYAVMPPGYPYYNPTPW